MSPEVKIYMNNKQLKYLTSTAKTRIFVGGRGCGKSHTIGMAAYIKATEMPRSRGFICSTTYNQLLTKTWPGISACWELLGLKEGRDYVKGVRPPKHFDKPISRVDSYKYLITMRNGSIIEFLSMDRPDGARGGSFDHGDIDEAALVKREHFTKVLLPAIRGNRIRWHDNPWWQQVGMYTSMPWKSSGLWVLDYEEKAQEKPDKYLYLTATAWDNIHIIGEEGIQRMREEMTYLEFQMEVMNEKMVKTEDAFYEGFDTDRHCYQPAYNYSEDDNGLDYTSGVQDVNSDALLDSSWDFGGRFSCCSVWQENPNLEERMVAAFNAQGEERVADIVGKFCEHFSRHRYKLVRLWGEPRGHDRNALMTDSVYDFIKREFAKQGWRVDIMATAKQSRQHVERQVYMSTILAEDTRGYPRIRINQDTCKWAIIALQGAQKTADGKKDKSTEKDPAFPQEHATHITDTVDYYFDQKWGPRVSSYGRTTVGTAASVDFL